MYMCYGMRRRDHLRIDDECQNLGVTTFSLSAGKQTSHQTGFYVDNMAVLICGSCSRRPM